MGGWRRRWCHWHAGGDLLQIAGDDAVVLLDAFRDGDKLAVGLSQLDQPHTDLVAIIDHINEFAELAGPQRNLRHQQRVGLFTKQQADGDILARQQCAIFVGDGGACHDRAGVAVDRVVDEAEVALVNQARVTRHGDLHGDCPGLPGLLDQGEIGLARREGDIDRADLDERIERRAAEGHERPDRRLVAPDAPGKRRVNLGVTEIDLGGLDRCPVGGHRRLALLHGADALVVHVLGECAALHQIAAAAKAGLGIVERGDVALHLRLCLIERRLVVARVDPVQKVALLHVRAVGCDLLEEIAGDLGLQRNAADRVHARGVGEVDGNGLLHHRRHRHGHGLAGMAGRGCARASDQGALIAHRNVGACGNRDDDHRCADADLPSPADLRSPHI